jgi:hypothetical protein
MMPSRTAAPARGSNDKALTQALPGLNGPSVSPIAESR